MNYYNQKNNKMKNLNVEYVIMILKQILIIHLQIVVIVKDLLNIYIYNVCKHGY